MALLSLGNLSAAPSGGQSKQPLGWLLPVVGGTAFTTVILVLLWIMPGPHRDLDYLVMGVVSVLVSLLAMFLALIKVSKNVFFRRKGS
jgi:hypothetical protein